MSAIGRVSIPAKRAFLRREFGCLAGAAVRTIGSRGVDMPGCFSGSLELEQLREDANYREAVPTGKELVQTAYDFYDWPLEEL